MRQNERNRNIANPGTYAVEQEGDDGLTTASQSEITSIGKRLERHVHGVDQNKLNS